MTEAPTVRILGVRHHGPGSARAVLAALEDLDPQVLLVEGPADADPLVGLAGAGMVPPVALLAYAADTPARSAFWPFAAFSPEWQAIRWGVARGIPVRFADLPAAVALAIRRDRDSTVGQSDPAEEPPSETLSTQQPTGSEGTPGGQEAAGVRVREDPIAVLAQTAGYDDPERWWDDVVESRQHEQAPFELITDAMRELREAGVGASGPGDRDCEVREAHMRQVLREVLKQGATRVAVVCGAWHAPALTMPLPPASRDAALLRGLPKVKTALTWIPWTHGRLSYASGYGAGVLSPGWYAHLFHSTELPVTDWLTRVAGVLRAEDLPVSSAHVIEAVRLAETLAVLRGRPLAGLAEVTDATLAVVCEGNPVTLDLVTRRLVVGEALGEVPDETPTVPLESDLAASSRRLKLPRRPLPATKDLDLRTPTDAARSRLLHRLLLLGVPWGSPGRSAVRATGTFRETWELHWKPEYALDVIEASMWGTTVESATAAKVCSDALGADLPGLTRLVEGALLADLGDAVPDLLAALDARAARDHDVSQLMQALPPLVRSLRYGDVRGTDTGSLGHVVDALLARICVGLTTAVSGLDADGATQVRTDLDAVHEAVALRGDEAGRDRWLGTLAGLVDRADIHGLLVGRMVRLLLDAGVLRTEQAGMRLSRALSIGSEPAVKAAWVEGFLSGSGLLLVHDAALLALLDDWVRHLDAEDFLAVVPLLRRTFGELASGERRAIGDAVSRLTHPHEAEPTTTLEWDRDRAAGAVATVAALLGLRPLAQRGGIPGGIPEGIPADPQGGAR